MKILIIEDEKLLADSLKLLLEGKGFTVETVYDGENGALYAETGVYDLLILDVMMPKMDGFQVAREVRAKRCTTPILMLTAKSELEDRIAGLNAGADYYLTKPFESEELLACIRSLLRRSGDEVSADAGETAFGDLKLQQSTFLLRCGDREVRLSRREYDLMELLMKNGSQIVTKEQLILKVWGYDSAAEDNNVEVYISFLRRKLTHLQSRVRIKTLRLVGYCLEVEE